MKFESSTLGGKLFWQLPKKSSGKSKPLTDAQKERRKRLAKERKEKILAENREQAKRNAERSSGNDRNWFIGIVPDWLSQQKAEKLLEQEFRQTVVSSHLKSRAEVLLRQTPQWANVEEIGVFYKARDILNRIFGKGRYHVDHIIPLQGRTVSGLHVESNLRVITARENLSKNNSLIEDLI
jgi:hypothetical protein